MLGAIIGDIVGSRWEFNPTNDYNFEWLSSENAFTDDTICTIAVADAILHDSDDYGKYIHEWCRKYPDPKGAYGGRFSQWVRSDNPQPYGSYGNGSAMRVSPIVWRFYTLKDVVENAKKSAECTHNHPWGIIGAQTVAFTIHLALYWSDYVTQDVVDMNKLMSYVETFSGYNLDIKKEDVINRFDETCQGTVPVALWIIKESTSFEDAVRKAVSLGADADTLGAIVGSIAGAIWGIPETMKQSIMVYLPDEMVDVITQFYELYSAEIER